MKTIVKVTLVLFVLNSFQSCSKDDAPEPEVISQPDPTPEPEPESENQAPTQVSLLAPNADAENIDVRPTFSWEAAIDPDGDQITYEIFADTSATPSTLLATTTETNFELQERLPLLETLNWKVVAKDGNGGESESIIAGFDTRTVFSGIVTNNAPFDGGYDNEAFVYENKIWMMSAYNNDLYNSTDGVNWTLINSELPFGAPNVSSTIFNGEIWIVNTGGGKVEMWHSSDGIEWALASDVLESPLGGIKELQAFQDKLYFFNSFDLWVSDDGVIWTQLPESPLSFNSVVPESFVYNERLYIKSGFLSRRLQYTEDGINWIDVAPSQDFVETSFRNKAVVFDNKIWEFDGGSENSINFSRDGGVTWEQALDESSIVVPTISGHALVVKEDKIFVLGGIDNKSDDTASDDVFFNSVWFFN